VGGGGLSGGSLEVALGVSFDVEIVGEDVHRNEKGAVAHGTRDVAIPEAVGAEDGPLLLDQEVHEGPVGPVDGGAERFFGVDDRPNQVLHAAAGRGVVVPNLHYVVNEFPTRQKETKGRGHPQVGEGTQLDGHASPTSQTKAGAEVVVPVELVMVGDVKVGHGLQWVVMGSPTVGDGCDIEFSWATNGNV